MAEEKYVSGMIAQVASTGKFLEFLDGLVPAYKAHYAMLQGAVGREYAPNSGIRISITDYSQEKSVAKNVLVPCYVFDEIGSVCLKNTGTLALHEGQVTQAVNSAFQTEEAVGRLGKTMGVIVNESLGALAAIVKNAPVLKEGEKASSGEGKDASNQEEKNGNAVKFGKALKTVREKMAEMKLSSSDVKILQVPFGVDYSYSQVRVFADKTGPDGLCPCNTLTITRKSVMTGKDGKPLIGQDGNPVIMKKPWSITIQTFDAKPVKHENGTVSYSGATAKNKVNLTFSASDAEMHKAVWSVNHFITQWERAQLGSFIEGAQARSAQYEKNRK